MNESTKLYEKEPNKFTIYHPSEDEIINRLKENFGFSKIENFLTSKNNYLFKIIKYSKKQYLSINDNNINLLEKHKKEYLDKTTYVEEIKKNI